MGWIITLYIPEYLCFGILVTGEKTRSFDRPVVVVGMKISLAVTGLTLVGIVYFFATALFGHTPMDF